MALSVAVVGCGPSGLYAADRILKKMPGARVDVIERLPTPYGLVRAGIAPDHQGTKNVIRQYGRILEAPGARFQGHVEIGRDVTLDELRTLYDAVVLATGAPCDRAVGLPGETLTGVVGSSAFTCWYNGHPDWAERPLLPAGTRRVVVIGNGNVALDAARVVAKTAAELVDTDIGGPARAALSAAAIESVVVAGRRGAADASCTPPELRELGHLEATLDIAAVTIPDALPAYVAADSADGRAKAKNLEILRGFRAAPRQGSSARTLRLLFNANPVEFLGSEGKLTAVRFEKSVVDPVSGVASGTGTFFEEAVDLAVLAVGYTSRPLPGAAFDDHRGRFANDNGRIDDRLYAVGWAKRGPSGTIPTNRADSFAVADLLLAAAGDGGNRPGPDGLDALLTQRSTRVVSYRDWLKIDAAETAAATPPAPREKLTSVAAQLAVAGV